MRIADFSQTAELIRKYRKEKGLSQSDLAKECGLSTATISGYERGDILPPLNRIEDIAKALNRAPLDFFTETIIDNNADIELLSALLKYHDFYIVDRKSTITSVDYLNLLSLGNEDLIIMFDDHKRLKLSVEELREITKECADYFKWCLGKLLNQNG